MTVKLSLKNLDTTHTSISNILFNLDKMFDEYEILNICKSNDEELNFSIATKK